MLGFVRMTTKPPQSMGPGAYATSLVDGVGIHYRDFCEALWSADKAVPANLKELIFCRTSIVNQCPT